MTVSFEVINGVAFGMEHYNGDEDDGFDWVIAVHFLCFRLCFYKV